MKALLHFAGAMLVVATTSIASPPSHLSVSSAAFAAGGDIPPSFTCKGVDRSPPLRFAGVPAGAKCLALVVDDPDAPGGLFTHWLVWNIAPATKEIGENSVPPDAAQGSNDFGKSGYGGPCPPSGTHRYIFHLLALDRRLDLKPGADRAAFDQAAAGHVLARGELMARFSH